MANKIVLKGNPDQETGTAGGTITPGHLLQLNSSDQYVVHGVAGGNHSAIFAIEDSLQGNSIGDDYTTGNKMQIVNCAPADEINAILHTNQTIAIGDYLESAGNGRLQEHGVDSGAVIYTRPIVAQAREAVTTTGATARIRVRIV